MIVGDIQRVFESWAPKEIAWEKDNTGLQIGNAQKKIRKILVTLDVNTKVIAEARRKKIDLIISHHPLLFRPLKSISTVDRTGQMVTQLIQNDIALYSAHTNLDFSRPGVSFTLAEQLGLREINFLVPSESVLKKIIVFVPAEYCNNVMTAMANAGAGTIGNYEQCSFQTEGTGTFLGSRLSKPFTGKAGTLEHVHEIRLEMITPSWKLQNVLTAMRHAHPYEEAAYDIYSLENRSGDHGAGAIGNLEKEMSLDSFLQRVQQRLHVKSLRYSKGKRNRIKLVAVCGGSGSDMLHDAIRQQADAFVTADVRYHTFQDAEERISLIDAGHFETEQPSVKTIVNYLKNYFQKRNERIEISASASSRNSVQCYL